ncbi:MAG: zinc ribbon domain-containing protein, partial [Clostridia bacterium]|nr:zinc ribbon domain-containing protein [Clostridia bacterium]
VAAAEAMKDAAKNEGNPMAGAGVSIGAGLGMGQIFAEAFKSLNSNQSAPKQNGGGKTCSACGASVSPSAKFCPECGQKLNAKSFCSECGEEVSPSAKFCPSCGKKLK